MYAIVDCDNCFVSCERVFQPDLKGKPVVVLSNNDGCVVARSNEAKQLGIKMGVPIYQIRDLVAQHGVEIRSSNYILYADMSNRVMSILRSQMQRDDLQDIIIEAVEQYSIDEAFLSVTVPSSARVELAEQPQTLTTSEPQTIKAWAESLVSQIAQWTGMPVSIGIAPTRTLAKAATWYAKHYADYHKVCIIHDETQRQKALQGLEIGEVWGVGWRSVDKYRYYGVNTAWNTLIGKRERRDMEKNEEMSW